MSWKKKVKEILEEAAKTDQEEDKEQGRDSNQNFVKEEKLKELKQKLEDRKKKLKESGKKTVSLTDKEANFMRHAQGHGIHLSYNGQLSADENGLILAADLVDKQYDGGELLKENLKQAEENCGTKIGTIVADTGYYETNAIKEITENGHKCLVPMHENAAKGKIKFTYDGKENTCTCEKGKKLKYLSERIDKGKKYKVYVADVKDCKACEFLGKCYKGSRGTTKEGRGRSVMIYEHQDFVDQHLKVLKDSEELYDKRKTVIEPVIGTIKTRHRFRRLLLRGVRKAKTELMLVVTGFNLLKIWKLEVKKLNQA